MSRWTVFSLPNFFNFCPSRKGLKEYLLSIKYVYNSFTNMYVVTEEIVWWWYYVYVNKISILFYSAGKMLKIGLPDNTPEADNTGLPYHTPEPSQLLQEPPFASPTFWDDIGIYPNNPISCFLERLKPASIASLHKICSVILYIHIWLRRSPIQKYRPYAHTSQNVDAVWC